MLKFFLPGCTKLHSHYAPRPLSRIHVARKSKFSPAPKISIVIPNLNYDAYIGQAIESVIDQNYPNIELIVIDGDSSDNSIEIIKSYSKYISHFESSKDNGQTEAINKGFSLCTGEIMGWLNSDDQLGPNALWNIARNFVEYPSIDVVYGNRVLMNESGNSEIGRWHLPPHNSKVIRYIDFVPQETMYWRKSIWIKIGGSLEPSMKFAMDWDLILKLDSTGASFKHDSSVLGLFRLHDRQKSQLLIDTEGKEEIDNIRASLHNNRSHVFDFMSKYYSKFCLVLYLIHAKFLDCYSSFRPHT